MVTSRFRTELTDVAWGYESSYGTIPPTSEMGSTTGSGKGRYFRQWGLVAGGITLPNPRYEFQQYMGIGVDSRNMLFPIRGPQTLEGTVSGAMLCHDSSRYMIEVGLGVAFNRYNKAAQHATTHVTGGTLTIENTTAGSTYGVIVGNAGTSAPTDLDLYNAATGDGTHIIIIAPDAATPLDVYRHSWAYIGAEVGSDNKFRVYRDRAMTQAGFNGKTPVAGANVDYGVFSVQRVPSLTGAIVQNLSDYKSYVDSSTQTGTKVVIREALTQHSFTIAAKFSADDGSNFITNYHGLKVGSMSFAFAEGEPVTYTVAFTGKDMRHNIGEDDGSATASSTVGQHKILKYQPKYTEAQHTANVADAANDIPSANSHVVEPSAVANTRVIEQPYFFTNAKITLRGTEFARFRSFNIAIDNGLDPRYYIRQNDEGATGANQQVISEILEGRRSITFSGSLDVDNTSNATEGTNPVDAMLLQHVLNQGQDLQSSSVSDVRDDAVIEGIAIAITLERAHDSSNSGSAGMDRIVFNLPAGGADGTSSTPGLVMRSASMDIAGPPQIHQAMDIDGFASSISIDLYDNVAAT